MPKNYVATFQSNVDMDDAILMVEEAGGRIVSSNFEESKIAFEAEPDEARSLEQFGPVVSVLEQLEEPETAGSIESF